MITVVLFLVVFVLLLGGVGFLIYKAVGRAPEKRRVFLAAFLLVFVFLLMVVPAFFFGQFLTIKQAFSFGVHSLVGVAGGNKWLAKALVAALIIPFAFAIRYVFSFSRSKRRLGAIIIGVYAVGYFLMMYAATQGEYFRHDTGEPTAWYSYDAYDGCYRVYSTPGYDTRTGRKLEPVTPEIAPQIERRKCSRKKIGALDEMFFDPITGQPLKWYYKADDGSYEFFSSPGYHTMTGKKLEPVTSEIVAQIRQEARSKERYEKEREKELARRQRELERQQANRAFLQKYVYLDSPKKTAPKTVLVLIYEVINAQELVQDQELTSEIEKRLKERGYAITSNIFKPAFYDDGFLEKLLQGNGQILSRLEFRKFADYLLVGEESVNFEVVTGLDKQMECNISLDYKLFRQDGERIKLSSMKKKAGGTDENSAKRVTHKIIAEKVAASLGI